MLGFLLQFVAAIPRHGRDGEEVQEDAAATAAPPVECASAASAEECADILAKAGRNPFAAYGVMGRQPVYRHRDPAVPTASKAGPAAPVSPAAGAEEVAATQEETPAFIGVPIPSSRLTYGVGDLPLERFGLDVVYGLVGTLREDTATKWKLFEYNIGLFDDVVRATYGSDDVVRHIDAKELVRSTDFICRAASKQLLSPPGPWTVVLRFVRWQDAEMLAGPFTVRQADCR